MRGVYFLIRMTLPAIALAALTVAMVGCGSSGPERAPIRGRVTVAGQPLASGRILFTPVAPTEGPATSARIVNGEYTIERKEGPLVGKNRIEIEDDIATDFALDDEAAYAQRAMTRTLPRSIVPPQYNRQSQITIEVQSGDENAFDLDIVPVQQYSQAYR